MCVKEYQIKTHNVLGAISSSIGCWIKKDVDSTLREILCYLLKGKIIEYQEIYYPESEIPSIWENALYSISFHLFGRDRWEWANKFQSENFVPDKVILRKNEIWGHHIVIGYFDLNKNINAEMKYYREHNYETPHTVIGFEYEVVEDDGRKYIKLCGGKFVSASYVEDIYDKYIYKFDVTPEEVEHTELADKINDQSTVENTVDLSTELAQYDLSVNKNLYGFEPYIPMEQGANVNKALPAECETDEKLKETITPIKDNNGNVCAYAICYDRGVYTNGGRVLIKEE